MTSAHVLDGNHLTVDIFIRVQRAPIGVVASGEQC